LTNQCRFIKASGEPCRGTATGPHGLCWAHAPENAEQRRRGASRGGRAKANGDVKALRLQLQDLTERVISGDLETGRGAVANQLITTQIKLHEYERKLKEMTDLEERLAALEEAQGKRRGARPWGA
jgi:hypothetical protein